MNVAPAQAGQEIVPPDPPAGLPLRNPNRRERTESTTNTPKERTMLAITLKRFQHYPRMSEETVAFNADLSYEGVTVGTAENDGHGGCTFIHLNDKGRAIPAILNASRTPEFGDGKINEDSLANIVDDLVEKTIHSKWVEKQRKKVEKQLATTVLFSRKGDKDGSFRTYNLKGKTPAEVLAFANQVAGQPDVTRVLNLMPFEDAFRLLVKVD